MSDVKFRLIGINQDNRADGTGKTGLTFQAIGYYPMILDKYGDFTVYMIMNNTDSNAGGWRDTLLRKNLNDESTGTIWNAIQSTDFKNNITTVLKTTNNGAYNYIGYYNSGNTSNASSTTVDKLFILSPSEMSIPIINNYKIINYFNKNDGNVHYYGSDTYKNTLKSRSDGNASYNWKVEYDYLYFGDTYQWWMLPAGSRKMSNGSQAYHNTDSYSYCTIANNSNSNPSTNASCNGSNYWLRSIWSHGNFSKFSDYYGEFELDASSYNSGVVLAFAF